MQKRRTALAAAICTLVLICVFAGIFLFSSMSYQTDQYKVKLPSQTQNDEELSSGILVDQPDIVVDLPELTPGNVQAVISSLDRPEQYFCAVTNTIYLSDGDTASWRADTYYKSGLYRVERFNASGSITEISLFSGDCVYIWEQGSTTYWSAPMGTVTADMTAMVPSYQEVCSLPVEEIAETELNYSNGEPCILVVSGTEKTEYYVSLVSGLLKNVKYYENGEIVREVTISALEQEVADSYFVLPDGEEPVFAAQS